jgi:Na+/H+ antiporter NhaD/arsenite permease-like protein
MLIAAISVLGLTVSLSLSRPTIGRIRIDPAKAAVLGALITLGVGILPIPELIRTIEFLSLPVLTIVSLMTITLIAERAGCFRLLAWHIAKPRGKACLS